MWLNQSCGVRRNVRRSLVATATTLEWRAPTPANGSVLRREAPANESLHPRAKERDTSHSAGGQIANVSNTSMAVQPRPAVTPPVPTPPNAERDHPSHVL